MFTLIWVWINGWVNNHEAGDLRRYRGHYDVRVMLPVLFGVASMGETWYKESKEKKLRIHEEHKQFGPLRNLNYINRHVIK